MFPFRRQPIVSTMPDQFHDTNLETYVLKVHVNCYGCKQKVNKILRKIEGVYTVSIDAEQDTVTVRGEVDSATLIKKLVKSGKPAKLFQPNSNQGFKQEESSNPSSKLDNIKKRNLMQHYLNNGGVMTTSKHQSIFPGLYDIGVEREWNIEGNEEGDTDLDEMDDFDLGPLSGSYDDEGSIEDDTIPMMDMERDHGYRDGGGYKVSGGHQFHNLRDFSQQIPGYVYRLQQHPSHSMTANMMGNNKFLNNNQYGYTGQMKADPRSLGFINNKMIADQYMHMMNQAPIVPQTYPGYNYYS